MSDTHPLLEVVNLKKHFPIHRGVFKKVVGHVKAVDGVSFTVYPGETVGIVGESGCGKTTVARLVMAAYPPTSGEMWFQPPRRSAPGESGYCRQCRTESHSPAYSNGISGSFRLSQSSDDGPGNFGGTACGE